MNARCLRDRGKSVDPLSLIQLVAAVILGCGLAIPAEAADPWSGPRKPGTKRSKQEPTPLAKGFHWFTHEWSSGDKVSRGGDGLGPVFNGASCVQCHSQGAIGGGGPLKNNVQIFAVQIAPFASDREELAKQALEMHPGLKEQPAVIMHRFASSPEYERWRNRRVSVVASSDLQAPSILAVFRQPAKANPANGFISILPSVNAVARRSSSARATEVKPMRPRITERNTTALFGDGLLDRLPDEIIQARAAALKPEPELLAKHRRPQGLAGANRPAVVGKVVILPDGRVGKFGWKAQHATLREFSMAACAIEVGLEVPGNHQGADPTAPFDPLPRSLDMDQAGCDELVAFVAALPRPTRQAPPHVRPALLARGDEVFKSIGCADCHSPDLGPIEGVYSDLLVHDMGGSLGDVGYYAMFVGDLARGPANKPQNEVKATVVAPTEWRTPPLWGVADSAPYLHDGSADTFDDAILRHGGQAAWSAEQYRMLKFDDKAALHWMLRSLRAPRTEDIRQLLVQRD